MRRRRPVVLVVLSLFTWAGCGEPVAPGDTGALSDAALPDVPLDAGAPGCVGSVDPIVCSGIVDPTTLGAGIEEVLAGLAGSGPGSHWYCAPGEGTPWNDRVLFYLVGTYGDPAVDHAFAARACELGFVAIAPMYENRVLTRAACGDDGACYLNFHVEVTDGGDAAPEPISVDADDSIRNRAATLLEHLAMRGAPWTSVRDRIAADDWSSVALAGHSQGSGHVAYLAREEAAERVILLAGPSERTGSGTPADSAVPWILALETMPLRTTLRLAYIHDDDDFQIVDQVVDSWDHMGLDDGTCAHDSAGGYAPSCRRIRVATDGCAGLDAHLTPIYRSWGARCRPGVGHDNQASWDHLLLSE